LSPLATAGEVLVWLGGVAGRFARRADGLGPSGGDELGDADQIIGDEIEQEAGGDTGDAAVLGLAHGAVLLAPAEDAFDHRAPPLRQAVARVACGALVDSAMAPFAGLGFGVVPRHMRRDVGGAQIGDMIGGVVGLVLR